MSFRWMRAAAILLGLAPAAAQAFETVDLIPFPSFGAFPAWPGDPIGPWTIFAYAGLAYDTNVFRRDSNEQDDIVARYGLGARAEQRIIGRQRVEVEGFGEYFDFNELSDIDHFGYGLRGAWLFEVGNQVNGAAVYQRRHRHADLGEFQVERRAMVTTDQFLIDGGYRFHPDWRIFGALDHTRSRREVDEGSDLDTSTARANIIYSTPLGNSAGIEVRGTRGDARFTDEVSGISFTNDYEEREIAALLTYALGAQLRISGRLGHTERKYTDLAERDFDGPTYRGTLDWLFTPKLIFRLEGYRYPQSVPDIDASHVVLQGTAFGASYAASFKLVFTARFVNERRLGEGSGEAVITGTPVTDETLRTWRFSVGWEPQRHWQLGLGYDVGDRSSNILGRDYAFQQVMLNGRFTF
jgi:hypothetical protein